MSPSLLGDTIRFPGEDEAPVVRPALAMLYRLAIGPNADGYARRFLAYEKSGHVRPAWHWPAFLVPPMWAAYRGLFGAAFLFGILPLLGAMAFVGVSPLIDGSDAAWWAWAALLVWIVPGVVATFSAHPMLYRRVRRFAQEAEEETMSAAQAAARVASERPTSLLGAAMGFAGMALVTGAVLLDLMDAQHERGIRRQVAGSLAAVRVLQQRVEDTWPSARLVPSQTGSVAATPAVRGVVEDVNVSPGNGRLRLTFGPRVPEIDGKAILLAPAIDATQHVRWLCVPVDIPARYLPRECVQR